MRKLFYLLIVLSLSIGWAWPSGYKVELDAADVSADTTDFDTNLSSADDTVQKALDTIDEFSLGGAVEGTAVLSTGEGGATKFLRENGDGTSSWQTVTAGHADTITWSGTSILETGAAHQLGDGTDATVTYTWANTGTDVPIAFSSGAMDVTGALTATNLSGTNTGDVTHALDLVTSSPLSGGQDNVMVGADGDVTISIADAAADGSTKGAASFTARDFSAASGIISSRKGDFWNGSFAESFDADVTSNGTTVTMSIEKTGTGNLTCQFSSGNTAYTTAPDTIALTAGSDTSPQGNWIYILESAPTTLEKSISAWPTTEHIKVGYFLVQSALSVQTDSGPFVNQNWNNMLMNGDNIGHMSHMSQKLRRLGSTYFSGIDGNGATAFYYTLSASNSEFISTSGVIDQLHSQTFPAMNTSTGSVVTVVNSSVGAYRRITDLFSITTDNTGATITNNKYFNLTIWGVINKTGERQMIMVNTPGGFYNTQSQAETDALSFDVFSMPREFSLDSSNGFLIARSTFQMGTTWTHIGTIDLRDLTVQNATGGAIGTPSDFADNAFTVFDNTDNTKVVTFDVGTNVTTGNTRTLGIPDESGLLMTEAGTPGGELGNTWASPTVDATHSGSAHHTIAGGGRSLTANAGNLDADAELFVYKSKIAFENPVDADDFFFDEIATTTTFTSIYCKTLVGTVDLDVTIAGSDINGTDITCNTTGILDASLAGDTAGVVGEEVALAITSVASVPTYLIVQLNGTYDD